MRVLLEFLCELDRLFDVEQPSLGGFLVLARVYLFVGFLDGEVKEFFLHVEGHILFLDDLEAVEVVERGDFFWFFGEVRCAFVADHGALEGIDEKVAFFEVHEGSFGFEDDSSDDGGEGEGEIAFHILVIGLLLVLVLLHEDGALLIRADFNGSLPVVVLDVDVHVLIEQHDEVLLDAFLGSKVKRTAPRCD